MAALADRQGLATVKFLADIPESKQTLANKIHFETLAAASRSGRELPPEVSERSVLTTEPGGVDYVETNLGDKTARWVQPKLAAKDRVLLYLHGGVRHQRP